jgi:hypothetical protein
MTQLLDWFYIGFGIGLGLLCSVLLVALFAGLLDHINHKLKWHRTFGGKT